jgi:pectin methylesterase-like acyl-CoA thioesterase
MSEKKSTAPTAPAAPVTATAPDVKALKAENLKLQSDLAALQKSAAGGVPFTGAYLEQYNAKIAAGLTPDQARAVTAHQIVHDEALAKAAKA